MGSHYIPPAVDGAQLIVAETEVFNGNTPDPSAWTALDLSGTVGSNFALVILKVDGDIKTVAFRQNGEVDEFYNVTLNTYGSGLQLIRGWGSSAVETVLVPTDSSGVIEWKAENVATACVIDIIAYIK